MLVYTGIVGIPFGFILEYELKLKTPITFNSVMSVSAGDVDKLSSAAKPRVRGVILKSLTHSSSSKLYFNSHKAFLTRRHLDIN